MKINSLGISEVRGLEVGETKSEDSYFVYSGGEEAVRGV